MAAAVAAPWLPLADPDRVDTSNRLLPLLTPGHLLGTDEFGRDMLSRLAWAARISLLSSVGATILAKLVGVALGLLGGYHTGWIEAVAMRLTDILMAFPYVLLAIAIVSLY
jgi:ABC-type dipeptide/oligopeptide/nickel transport system permease subunit